jgi:hypothetical protein
MGKKRGFIAAPLLGTLIFLAAVLFVVQITQVDRSEVARLTDQAYQERVATDLEDFRSDLGTLFSVSVARAVQDYLAKPCWVVFSLGNSPEYESPPYLDSNTFSVPAQGIAYPANNQSAIDYNNLPFCNNLAPTNPLDYCEPNPAYNMYPECVEQCNHEINYYQLRYEQCASVSNDVLNGVCSIDPSYGVQGWISAILSGSGGGAQCAITSDGCITTGSPGPTGNFSIPAGADPTQGGTCTANSNIQCQTGISPAPPSGSAGTYTPSGQSVFSFEGVNFNVPNAALAQGLTQQGGCEFGSGSSAYVVTDPNMYLQPSSGSTCYGTCGAGTSCSNPTINLNQQNSCSCTSASCIAPQGSSSPVPLGTSCAGVQGSYTSNLQADQLCRQLIGNSLFDCRQFAEHTNTNDCGPGSTDNNAQCPFRCCSKYAQFNPANSAGVNQYAGMCCADSSIPGSDLSQLGCDPTPQANQKYLIAGCEGGDFAFQLNTTTSNLLYESIPRAQATDASGNVLSASALTDKITYIPIQYPLYKYLDAALKAYAPVAYGVSDPTPAGSTAPSADFMSPQQNMLLFSSQPSNPRGFLISSGSSMGVTQGLCYGALCNAASPGLNPTTYSYNPSAYALTRILFSNRFPAVLLPSAACASATTAAGTATCVAEQNFVNTFLNPYVAGSTLQNPTGICRLFQPQTCAAYGLCSIELWIGWGSYGSVNSLRQLCPNTDATLFAPSVYDSVTSTWTNPNSLYYPSVAASTTQSGYCNPTASYGPICGYVQTPDFTMQFRDRNPAALVSVSTTDATGAYNPFCWYLNPTLFQPCNINPLTGTCT